MVVALGLSLEFSGRCVPSGDVSAWAPVDTAWAKFFLEHLKLTKEALIRGAFVPLLYDILLFSMITQYNAPLQPQFISDGDSYPTHLQKRWASPAELTFRRADSDAAGAGLLGGLPLGWAGAATTTQVFLFNSAEAAAAASEDPAATAARAAGSAAGAGGAAAAAGDEGSWWGASSAAAGGALGAALRPLGATRAQLVPPELARGQLAVNGDLHSTDAVLLPPLPAVCALAEFEFFSGRAFTSGYAGPSSLGLPRQIELPPCAALPCTFDVPDLYFRGQRLSVEAVVVFKPGLASFCEPYCPEGSWWWCPQCKGVVGQTIMTLGGCAPYQPQCGGSLSLWVTDAGQARN